MRNTRFILPIYLLASGIVDAGNPSLLDNNLGVVDLSDLDGDLPLDFDSSTRLLQRSENWEHPTWQNPSWPQGGGDSLGMPSVVKNIHGPRPDDKYYYYYAHHDPSSGIGVAVAPSIEGPYQKVDVPGRSDNQVLPSFQYPAHPDSPDHTSSPCVVWNEDEQRWFLYFHFYNHYWGTWGGPGRGHQMTGLATCSDLASHDWTIWEGTRFGSDTAPPYRPMLPTTDASWMESQSSYHSVQRLPDGRWLAFLRGTPNDGSRTKLGFATSNDGRSWNYFPQNPVIHQSDGGGRGGLYRPAFVGYLGKNTAGVDEYLLAWSESPSAGDVPNLIDGRTTDFIHVTRDRRGHADWPAADAQVNAWREEDRLYLFSGKHVYMMQLSVVPQGPGPFLRGDCNDDANVNISDAVSTLGSLFLGEGDPDCDDACDSNDDGAVDISDAIVTLVVLFLGNGVIPPPGMSECGVDPTDDELGCDTFEMCP